MMQAHKFYCQSCIDAIPISLYKKHDNSWKELNEKIKSQLLEHNFTGSIGDFVCIHDAAGKIRHIYIGAGEHNSDEAQALASIIGNLPPNTYKVTNKLSNQAMLYWSLAQYKYQITNKTITKKARVLVMPDKYIISLAETIFYVRDLINMPANLLNPETLADASLKLAKTYNAKYQEIIGDKLLKHNYPAIHTVGNASTFAPRLLEITFGNKRDPRICLIGKGVCFDSGGLDIKNSSGMRNMKKDMGGAANILGLAKWIMEHKLKVCLTVLIPAVENSISANSFRPGDVITMRDGTTVEIENTDAEGRLVLADCISKCCEIKPELIIDMATLTGAARVAVGTEISAMFSNNDLIAKELLRCADKMHDPVWRLPLHKAYKTMLHSNIADMANSTNSSYAGAITAALFLQHFVKNDIPWLHFDIMSWNLSSQPGKPEGGEAMGILALTEYLSKRY
jgi:leucyl aminopeptidase